MFIPLDMDESVDLDFIYDDTDKFDSEIAELYSYSEEEEFDIHSVCFYNVLKTRGHENWTSMTALDRYKFFEFTLNELEITDSIRRDSAVQSLLYLVQGVYSEVTSKSEQQMFSRENVYLLLENGLFSSLIGILALEMEYATEKSDDNMKSSISLADSTQLRFVLNVLYTTIETLRWKSDFDSEDQLKLRRSFFVELNYPYIGDESLAIMLFNMVTRFCGGNAPHFPMKKVLLLLWKTVLVTLGGLSDLYEAKNAKRLEIGLAPMFEDPQEVAKTMRSCSPPANAADLIEQQLPRRPFRSSKRGLMKQSGMEEGSEGTERNFIDDEPNVLSEEDLNTEIDIARTNEQNQYTTPPRLLTPSISRVHKVLPWRPKVRQKDLEAFLDATRMKFVGFHVKNDIDSLAGLPQPIHEGVRIIKEHLYVSLSDLQIKREEELAVNHLSMSEGHVEESPTEMLYQALLPCLPQHMIALLKVLLAAAPTSKAKTDSINVLSDVLPAGMPSSIVQSMKLGLDVNRHKEIIVKAVSAILLLLLKYFKLNHIYQFEYMSQHLVFANCIPLILKFFNQNIISYVSAKNNISIIDFPQCVIGEPTEITAENLESGDVEGYCWRNLFSCINLLRVLNKLTKWKHSRTMMLVVFKSAPILKRALKVRQALMQLYVLKLIKMQTKYLGRQWRKSNMKTMSAIYQNVRHRLNDDWAYGNDIDARPWDFQADECALRACVERFNNRRYNADSCHPDFQPLDNCPLSVLGQNVELSEDFQRNYSRWLETEVFATEIDWNMVLNQ